MQKRKDKSFTNPQIKAILAGLIGAGIGVGAYHYSTPEQRAQFTNMFNVPVSSGIAGIRKFRRGVGELRGLQRDLRFVTRL